MRSIKSPEEMDEFIVICYSVNNERLEGLLKEARQYLEDSAEQIGFTNEAELLRVAGNHQRKDRIQLLLLDIQELKEDTLSFLNKVNLSVPNAIKMVISSSNNLFEIQNQIAVLDSFHFLHEPHNSFDFKIALRTTRNCYENLQIVMNYKSEVSSYSKKLEEKVAAQIEVLNNLNLAKEKQFSIIAHDLKSPFTALLGISEILIDDWNDLSNKEKLDLVKGLKATSENTYKLLENLSGGPKTAR